MKLILFLCLFQSYFLGSVKSESFTITLQTLQSGTDAEVRVKLIGTLGESNFQTLGSAGYFSEPDIRKDAKITTTEIVGSILQITITLINSPQKIAIFIGTVKVVRDGHDRQVTFQFNEQISVGVTRSRSAPSPDLENPSILSFPQNTSISGTATLKEGLTFSLQAAVQRKGLSQDNIVYQWYRSNPAASPSPVPVGSNAAVLRVESVQSSDAGSYFCVMSLGDSLQKTESISLVVNYLELNPVSVSLFGASFVQEGNQIKLACSASSNLPSIRVSWNNGTNEIMNGITRITLDLPAIQRNQSGDYTCRAQVTGLEEVKNHTTTVKVLYLDPPKIRGHTIINNTLRLLPNESSELICESASNPPLITYTFTEDGKELTANGNKFIVKTGGGLYSCTVKNEFITRTIEFTIQAGTLVGPGNGNGGNTGGSTGGDDSGDDFWTTEMIVIVAMAIVFFLILILLIAIICMLLKRTAYDDRDAPRKQKGMKMTEQQDIFYRPERDFQNNYINDTLTSQRGPATLGDIQKMPPIKESNSQFSLSSEEYKSSNNDIPVVLANGKHRAEKQDILPPNDAYATVNKEKKHHHHRHKDEQRGDRKKRSSKSGDRSRSHSRQSRKSEEVGESSGGGDGHHLKPSDNWSNANDSKVLENYNNVEYC